MFKKNSIKNSTYYRYKYLIDKYPECTFIVSHIDDNTREELQKLKLKNVIIPTDGLEIEI